MTPHIIRTVEELLALDPDTAVTLYEWDSTIWSARFFQEEAQDCNDVNLPAVVVASAEQVRQSREVIRAARKALEELS